MLSHLRGEGDTQLDLFGEALRAERVRRIYDGVDQLDAKYGKHTVFLGSSFPALQGQQHTGDRAELPPPALHATARRGRAETSRYSTPRGCPVMMRMAPAGHGSATA